MMNEAGAELIPVVDLSRLSVDKEALEKREELRSLAEQICDAFGKTGFVYLKNHGVSSDQIDEVLDTMDKFFTLDKETKFKYAKKDLSVLNGYDVHEKASTADLKESFDFDNLEEEAFDYWPTEVPELKEHVKSFYRQMSTLALRVLSMLSLGLNPDSVAADAFERSFSEHMGCGKNGTHLRFNFYPMIPGENQVEPGQLRCVAHKDLSAITLLIQDNAGGLEIADGENFTPVPPVKGTIMVIIGDLMQRWTGDKLTSTVHRVVIPESEGRRQVPRRSIAMFVHPDRDAKIAPLDSSEKYPPIKAGDYLAGRLPTLYN